MPQSVLSLLGMIFLGKMQSGRLCTEVGRGMAVNQSDPKKVDSVCFGRSQYSQAYADEPAPLPGTYYCSRYQELHRYCWWTQLKPFPGLPLDKKSRDSCSWHKEIAGCTSAFAIDKIDTKQDVNVTSHGPWLFVDTFARGTNFVLH